jgi:hypothetical protein
MNLRAVKRAFIVGRLSAAADWLCTAVAHWSQVNCLAARRTAGGGGKKSNSLLQLGCDDAIRRRRPPRPYYKTDVVKAWHKKKKKRKVAYGTKQEHNLHARR